MRRRLVGVDGRMALGVGEKWRMSSRWLVCGVGDVVDGGVASERTLPKDAASFVGALSGCLCERHGRGALAICVWRVGGFWW